MIRISLGLSGLLVALFPAVGVLSRISGGVLSDRLFGGRRRPVVILSFVVAVPLLGSFPVLRAVAALVVSLVVAGFAIQLMIGLSFAYVRELVPGRVGGTAVAFHTGVGMGGAFAAPIVGGAVIDAVGVAVAWAAPEPG